MVDSLNRLLQNGLNRYGDLVDTIKSVITTGDTSIKAIDDALRGNALPLSPDQAFSDIYTHLTSMRELARGGYASSPAVSQKAREILGLVNQVEPPWKARPSSIRTQADMVRTAVRDLRGSQAIQKLASGQGSSEDIEALLAWMSQVSGQVKGYPVAEAAPAEPAPAAAGIPGMGKLPAKKGGLTTEETIAHQNSEITKHALLLEGHLQQKCKIGGKACDCCEKHPIIIQGLAEEAIGMVDSPIYSRIIAWCQKVSPISTEAASASGKYDELYPKLAIELRDMRKTLD